MVWVINWQLVWLEYCWHAVNLDKQTLDTGVLRKKNYSYDINTCYMYLLKYNKENK